MRKIKKYANRKLYDTSDKKYISMDRLAELIKAGEEVTIEDNKTGADLTASIVSQLIAREKKANEEAVPSRILIQLLRKGGGTLADYAKKYTSLWQSALTMAEDEIDRFINLLVKDKEISKSEGSKLKKEIIGYTENLKGWIREHIDQQMKEMLGMMNLATMDQVRSVSTEIADLARKVERIEKLCAEISDQQHHKGGQ